jgi:hypothetical protein
MDAYAIYTNLCSCLGADSKVLKGVQFIKTRFTLLPVSPDTLPALEAQKKTIFMFFNTCQIERSSRWISYQVINISRKIGQLTISQYSMVFVNLEILSTKVTKATGLTSISVIETSTSAANLITILSSWFINFFKNNKAKLPK